MKKIDCLATVLIMVGAINWGVIGLFDFDFIDFLFERAWVDRLVYSLMGISALYKIVNWQAIKERCKL